MIRNIVPGFYLLLWHILVVYKSRLNEGVLYSLTGQFQKAIEIMNMEWTLFIPSVYLFAICDCYYRSIEINQIFKMEQARFLEENYNSHKQAYF
jgi:flagellar biosynthesis protein FlhB